MKIIHLISTPSLINYGVWTVVLKVFPLLKMEFSVEGEIWFPETEDALHDDIRSVQWRSVSSGANASIRALRQYDPQETIVVSHGNWSLPTRWGRIAQREGYRWVVVPHGMLEPWSMRQRWLLKQVYFHFIEKPRLAKADAVIAVAKPEYNRLKSWFRNTVHISNGIFPYRGAVRKPDLPVRFLFLGRLHHKKGVIPLVEAWTTSGLMGHEKYELIIAGPDEGEGEKIGNMLSEVRARNSGVVNIRLPGMVEGNEKKEMLLSSQFLILPSFQEGFSTAVLEGMTYGCIPLITDSCNFPEAYEEKIAIRIATESSDIRRGLEEAAKLAVGRRREMAVRCKLYVDQNYDWKQIVYQQYRLYKQLLPK